MSQALSWDNVVDYAERYDVSTAEAKREIQEAWDDWFNKQFDVEDCPRWFS